ncbi:hypothetical protein EON66_05795, partial [archaeon]
MQSLNMGARKREIERIATENAHLIRRIAEVPHISVFDSTTRTTSRVGEEDEEHAAHRRHAGGGRGASTTDESATAGVDAEVAAAASRGGGARVPARSTSTTGGAGGHAGAKAGLSTGGARGRAGLSGSASTPALGASTAAGRLGGAGGTLSRARHAGIAALGNTSASGDNATAAARRDKKPDASSVPSAARSPSPPHTSLPATGSDIASAPPTNETYDADNVRATPAGSAPQSSARPAGPLPPVAGTAPSPMDSAAAHPVLSRSRSGLHIYQETSLSELSKVYKDYQERMNVQPQPSASLDRTLLPILQDSAYPATGDYAAAAQHSQHQSPIITARRSPRTTAEPGTLSLTSTRTLQKAPSSSGLLKHTNSASNLAAPWSVPSVQNPYLHRTLSGQVVHRLQPPGARAPSTHADVSGAATELAPHSAPPLTVALESEHSHASDDEHGYSDAEEEKEEEEHAQAAVMSAPVSEDVQPPALAAPAPESVNPRIPARVQEADNEEYEEAFEAEEAERKHPDGGDVAPPAVVQDEHAVDASHDVRTSVADESAHTPREHSPERIVSEISKLQLSSPGEQELNEEDVVVDPPGATGRRTERDSTVRSASSNRSGSSRSIAHSRRISEASVGK